MKIAENVKTAFAKADPAWADSTADLAHAIVERALSMPVSELREFVAPTQKGGSVTQTTDAELAAMTVMARNALI